MTLNQKVLFAATLRLVVWVAIVGIVWKNHGFSDAMIWPLLALQHRLGRKLRG